MIMDGEDGAASSSSHTTIGSANSGPLGTTEASLMDEKMMQVLKQIQTYKLLAAKVPVIPEPPADGPALSAKEYRTSAAYLAASDMPTFNLIDIANYALTATSSELNRKVVDARASMVPSQLSWAMDPADMVSVHLDQERVLREARIADLEAKLSNTSLEGASDESERIKRMIELKTLRLADKQRALRDQVLRHAQYTAQYDAHFDTTTYRRPKKQSVREARLVERAVREHRAHSKTVQSRKTNDEFLRRLSAQMLKVTGDAKAAQQRSARISKAVMQFHNQAEKEEQKRQERLAKERIKALRADDEEAYLKLIDQEKDTRLTHLLKQTDEFLEGLASRVLAQQAEAKVPSALMVVEESESADTAAMEVDEGASTVNMQDYYGTAHKVREEIVEQPKILTGGRLKEYQIKGLQWLVSLYNNHLNGILADEMGLGKTIQAISLISYLMEVKRQTGPFLIIVPLSTITNWVNEFEKWAPGIIKVEYKGSQGQRKAAQASIRSATFNVLITTYEYIIKDRPFLCKIRWLYMIIDEGHRMKNTQSKLVTTLTQYYSSRFRLILTGTPLQNNLPELWALLNFTLPRIFNSSKTFEEWFNAPFANTGERVELNEEETLLIIRRLHKVLRPFLLRRMKKDVESELPDKIERVIKCPMSALQHRLYALVRQKSSVALNEGGQDGRAVGLRRLNNTIMQLRKICNHPFVFDEVEDQLNPSRISNDTLWRVSGKFELLSRLLPKLKSTGHRVLIFFQMTQVMTIMEDFLHLLGLSYLRLDGSTKTEDRGDMLKRFNAPDSPYFAFLLSTRAGGLGLNLQSADTVIIFDSDWNPHQDLQAQDRAHRIGQTKEVRIFRLITVDSVEEYILERAQFKLSLDGKVIQAGKFDNKSTNEEREALLRTLLEGDQERNDEDQVYDDDELNEIVARNDTELEFFRQQDEERKREWAGRSRLVEDRELPRVYINEDDANIDSQAAKSLQSVPTGRRRKEVNYNENVSDRKWLKELYGEDAEEDQPDDAEEDPSTDSKKKKRRVTTKITLKIPSRKTDLSKLQGIIDRVEAEADEQGRSRSEIFRDLPSAQMYPDYFRLIKRPMCLSMIQERLDAGKYETLDSIMADFDQMWDNAMYYNQEGSFVWEDAAFLKELVHELADSISKGGEVVLSNDEGEGEESAESEYDNESDEEIHV